MSTDLKHRELSDSEEGIKFKSGKSYFHQPAGLMLVISSVRTWNLILHKKGSFPIKDFSSKCDEIRRKLRIYSDLLKKSLMENFFFCLKFQTSSTYLTVVQNNGDRCTFQRYLSKKQNHFQQLTIFKGCFSSAPNICPKWYCLRYFNSL